MSKIIALIVASIVIVKFQACSEVNFTSAENDLLSLSADGNVVTEKVLIDPQTRSESVPFKLVLVIDESKSMAPYVNILNSGLRDLLSGLRGRNVDAEVYFSNDPKNCNSLQTSAGGRTTRCDIAQPSLKSSFSEFDSNFDQKVNSFYNSITSQLDDIRRRASNRDISPYSACTVLRRLRKAFDINEQGAVSFVVITDENDSSRTSNCYREHENVSQVSGNISYYRLKYQQKRIQYTYDRIGEGGSLISSTTSTSFTNTSSWREGASCTAADVAGRSRLNVRNCTYTSGRSYTVLRNGDEHMCRSGIENYRSQLLAKIPSMVPGSSLECSLENQSQHDRRDYYLGFSSSIRFDTKSSNNSLKSYTISNEFKDLVNNYGSNKVTFTPIVISDRSQIRNNDQEIGSVYIGMASSINSSNTVTPINASNYQSALAPIQTFAQRFYSKSYDVNSKFFGVKKRSVVRRAVAYFGATSRVIDGVSMSGNKIFLANSELLAGATRVEIYVDHILAE